MGRLQVTSRLSIPASWALWVGVGLAMILLTGCGRSTFVGRQYDDFTAYYNKFHNADKAFKEGERAFQDQERTIDRTRYLSVFPVPTETQKESSFQKAIQKSSDILRDHPNSRWADDALLLIGKSYFYQSNYVGAAQKFREALGLEEGGKAEARFWLARTLVTNEQLDAAAEVLGRAIDTTTVPENEWRARMHLVQGELRVRREQWQRAATSLERGLEGSVPDAAGGRAAFLLGQVYETLGAWERAQAAYRRVQDYDPAYKLAFAARLSEIELQGQHGDAAAALERLRDLQSDDKNRENRGQMALVEARIHRAQGRLAKARSVLRKGLYDRSEDLSMSQTTTRRLHYELARLYRDKFEDFSRAAAHFDTASTTGQQDAEGAGAGKYLPTAPTNVEAQADQYRTLADRSARVARLDSLLRIGSMSDSTFQAFVAEKKRERRAERERAQEAVSSRSRQLQARAQSDEDQQANSNTVVQTRNSEAGFLFYKEPSRVQQGRRRFEATWGDRPRVDNWRRRNAIERAEEEPDDPTTGDGQTASADTTSTSREAGGLDLSAIPRDSSSQAKMKADRAVARYELGNALLLAAGRPDSAATWYRRVLQEDGDQPVAQRALYALAEAYWEQGDTTAARQTYEQLVEQSPGSKLAARARLRLGQRTDESEQRRSARADSAYGRAYRQWEAAEGKAALDAFLNVVQQYPDTEAAPRALLAASVVYWNQLQAESGAVSQGRVDWYLRSVQQDKSRRDTSGSGGTVDSSAMDTWPRKPERKWAPADSGRADSLRAEAADSSITSRDSVRSARPDSVRIDSARTDSAAADSAATRRGDPHQTLKELLRHLTQRYPESPQRTRAKSLLALMDERTAASDSVSADSVSTPPGPGREEAQPARAVASESGASGPPDASRLERPERPTERTKEDPDPLPAPSSVQSAPSQSEARSGWTVGVQAFEEADSAEEERKRLQSQLGEKWSVAVVHDTTASPAHRLVVGQFDSRADAQAARKQLQEQIEGGLQIQRR